MERSIENIWKEGFLNTASLDTPKINNMYSQKSLHIVDRFKRMGKRNLYGIAIGATIFLLFSIFAKVGFIGIFVALLMYYLIWVGRRQSRYLEAIQYGSSSYVYLKSFNDWLQNSIDEYRKVYRFIYPMLFTAFIIGTLFARILDQESIISKIMNDPDTYLVQGLPVYWILPLALIVFLSFAFSGTLYKLDLYSVYGGILRKLEELLMDMDELRSDPTG